MQNVDGQINFLFAVGKEIFCFGLDIANWLAGMRRVTGKLSVMLRSSEILVRMSKVNCFCVLLMIVVSSLRFHASCSYFRHT